MWFAFTPQPQLQSTQRHVFPPSHLLCLVRMSFLFEFPALLPSPWDWGEGPRSCISNEIPGDAASSRPTFLASRVQGLGCAPKDTPFSALMVTVAAMYAAPLFASPSVFCVLFLLSQQPHEESGIILVLHRKKLRFGEVQIGAQNPTETHWWCWCSDPMAEAPSPWASPAPSRLLHLQWSLLLDTEHLPPEGSGHSSPWF